MTRRHQIDDDGVLRRELAPRLQVAVGGAAGASLRVAVVGLLGVGATGWPWGVLLANLAGALLLGWLVGRAPAAERLAAWLPLLGTGIAGSMTTFSALAVDLARLGADDPLLAVAYAGTSVVAGTVAALAGLRWGRRRP